MTFTQWSAALLIGGFGLFGLFGVLCLLLAWGPILAACLIMVEGFVPSSIFAAIAIPHWRDL